MNTPMIPLISVGALILLCGLFGFPYLIRMAHRKKWMDQPIGRRRHSQPTPIVGGAGIFSLWVLGIAVFSFLQPQWFASHSQSLFALGVSLGMLITLGLWDDLKGLGPAPKLLVEAIASANLLLFEPHLHQALLGWQDQFGPIVWVAATLWLVGITNATNLIDGMDGLAGGMSLLNALAILVFSAVSGTSSAVFALVTITLLLPAIASFLAFNWNPAKIFLGDNGSLPIGFTLGFLSLICQPHSSSMTFYSSLFLMFGYPMLDMCLCVRRRYANQFPIFKADRAHLHYRIKRLGLSVKQTVLLLLSIGLYLQASALCVNIQSPFVHLMWILMTGISLSSILFLVRSLEKWQVNRVSSWMEAELAPQVSSKSSLCVAEIDLVPILEASHLSGKSYNKKLISALEIFLHSEIRSGDQLLIKDKKAILLLRGVPDQEVPVIQQRLSARIQNFISLYNLECSLASLPIRIERTA